MAGGDSRVSLQSEGMGRLTQAREVIDAHSVRSGDFTEARSPDGKRVFFTADGANAFDAFLREHRRDEGNAVSVRVSTDPTSLFDRLFEWATRTANERERHQGQAQAKDAP